MFNHPRAILLALATAAVCTGLGASRVFATDLAFSDTPRVSASGNATELAIGDMNNNGGPDLVVANGYENTVSIFFHSGPGVAYFRHDLTDVGGTAISVAVADFNRDGLNDLAVANPTTGVISILTNVGNGQTFSRSSVFGGPALVRIIAADMNSDSAPDIVTMESNAIVSVLLNQGSGTFSHRTSYLAVRAGTAKDVVVADLTGDQLPDVAVVTSNTCCNFDSTGVGILRSAGGGDLPPGNWTS